MRSIVDDIRQVVLLMRERTDGVIPHYMPGHRQEISNRLLNQAKDNLKVRYPLLVLFSPFDEEAIEGLNEITLNVGLFHSTDLKYNTEQRNELVIKPILYPLVELFYQCLKDSGLFFWEGDQTQPPCTKVDRPLWSIEERDKKVRNIFAEPLDAVLLSNLRLKQTIKYCPTTLSPYAALSTVLTSPQEGDLMIFEDGHYVHINITELAERLQNIPTV